MIIFRIGVRGMSWRSGWRGCLVRIELLRSKRHANISGSMIYRIFLEETLEHCFIAIEMEYMVLFLGLEGGLSSLHDCDY